VNLLFVSGERIRLDDADEDWEDDCAE
jgi:hypothetical protein